MPHNTPEEKHLGKPTTIPTSYNPGVLVAVPRAVNRQALGFNSRQHHFAGQDVWHVYEPSFLTAKGLPVTGVLKIVYDAHTPNLVESKSLKLYLNSHNQEKRGKTPDEAIRIYEQCVKKDLERIIGGAVRLKFHQAPVRYGAKPWQEYDIIEQMPGVEELSFTASSEAPELIHMQQSAETVRLGTHLLKSNCKITHQPDWGALFLRMTGTAVRPFPFLQYIVSLRMEDHFHEEIAELLMKRLSDKAPQSDIMVACHYTRRGGIDINPIRYNGDHEIPTAFTDEKVLTPPLFRQ